MGPLKEVIVFTSNLESMTRFYAEGVGLRTVHAGPHGTRFDTTGAALALLALPEGREREMELTFETSSIEADVQRLRARGVEVDEVRSESSVRRAQCRDQEGNRLSLRQGGSDGEEGGGPAIATVIVNCRDLVEALAFYRDRLGLKVAYEAPHWVELDTGETRLALHTRPTGLTHPLHAAQRVAYCLESPELDGWVEEMRARGLHFATAPIEEEFGLYAEVLDPDGNVVVFREPRPEPSLEEELAEEFESDEVPHVVAIRKPVLKGAKAVSRVALRPEYLEPERILPARQPKPASEPRPSAPSVRGGGPERTRQKPRHSYDPERIKTKPAIGRLRKAERKTLTSKKKSVASASKRKPVKRAVARTTRGR